MGTTSDKAKGAANEAAGKMKKTAGKAIDSTKMRDKGVAQEEKVKAQQAVGKAKASVKKSG